MIKKLLACSIFFALVGCGSNSKDKGVHAAEEPLRPEQVKAFQLLDRALAKLKTVKDATPYAYQAARIAMAVKPNRGMEYVKQAAGILAKTPLPLSRSGSPYGLLAGLMAPYDILERDRLLALAVEEGRRALKDEAIWKSEPLPPGVIPYVSPERAALDSKQILTHSVALWELLLKARDNPGASREDLNTLIKAAEASGSTGGDAPSNFAYFLLRELASLDSKLLIESDAGFPSQAAKAEFCYEVASNRGTRDPFTRSLITFAIREVKHSRALSLYAQFEPEEARKLGQDNSKESSSKRGYRRFDRTTSAEARSQRVQELLALLKTKQNDDIRIFEIEELLKLDHAIGLKKLEEILPDIPQNQLKNMSIYISRASPEALLMLYRANPLPEKLYKVNDFAVLARADGAFAEAEARKLPPNQRDTALGYVAVGLARTNWGHAKELLDALPEERRKYFNFDPYVHLLVAHPEQCSEIPQANRMAILKHAVVLGWWESGTAAVLEKMLETLPAVEANDYAESDQLLATLASAAVRQDFDLALRLLERIQSAHQYITAACSVAESVLKSEE